MRRRLHGENEFVECIMSSKEWMMRRKISRTNFNEKSPTETLKDA